MEAVADATRTLGKTSTLLSAANRKTVEAEARAAALDSQLMALQHEQVRP